MVFVNVVDALILASVCSLAGYHIGGIMMAVRCHRKHTKLMSEMHDDFVKIVKSN